MSEQTEEEYLIERLSKLLAEISVIVNGPQPMGVLWSYADLPQKVQALKDAAALNAQAGAVEALQAAVDENDGGLRYEHQDDDVGTRVCCGEVGYKPHAVGCWVTKARAALAATKGEKM